MRDGANARRFAFEASVWRKRQPFVGEEVNYMVAPWWNTCVPFTEVMDALWLVKLDPSQYLRRLSGARSGRETAGEGLQSCVRRAGDSVLDHNRVPVRKTGAYERIRCHKEAAWVESGGGICTSIAFARAVIEAMIAAAAKVIKDIPHT